MKRAPIEVTALLERDASPPDPWSLRALPALEAVRPKAAVANPAAGRRGKFRARRVAIVGATGNADQLLRKLQLCRGGPVSLLGVFDDQRPALAAKACSSGALAGMAVRPLDALIAEAQQSPPDIIVLALPPGEMAAIRVALARLRALPAEIALLDDENSYPILVGRRSYLAGAPLRVLVERPISRAGACVKRAMDVAVALPVLAICAPLLLLIALAIALESPGGVLFRQQRIGFNNQPFTLLKFRTMIADAPDQEGALGTRRADPRVTRVGRVLRRFSLDELPQLLNVLAGSMSIIGPRPHTRVMQIGEHPYAEAVPAYAQRHRMKPGLTGWAQVNGSRGGIHTLDKAAWAAAMDLEYVQRWTLWLDLQILLRTVGLVLSGRGAL